MLGPPHLDRILQFLRFAMSRSAMRSQTLMLGPRRVDPTIIMDVIFRQLDV